MPTEAPWLDWELDESNYTCTIISGDLPPGGRLEFKRDRDFALDVVVRFPSLTAEAVKAIPDVVNAIGRTVAGAEVTIRNAFMRTRTGSKGGTFTFHIEPTDLSIKYSAVAPVRVVEWLANFGSDLMFPRHTDSSVAVSIARNRSESVWSSKIELGNDNGFAPDHLVLRCFIGTRKLSFLLGTCTVAKDRAIRPGFIEHLDQGTGLPTEKERELVRTAISFIFDHQLVLLGDTSFDASHKPISGRAFDAMYLGARYLLRNRAELPAPVYDEAQSHLLSEERVSALLQLFIEQNARFRLDRVVQKMWDARTSTLDTRIARFIATIELLRDIYLGDGESLLSKKDWAKICSEMKVTLAKIATEIGVTDKKAIKHLLAKLPNINFASSTKQFDRFFEALKLTISDTEQVAMDKRNDQAHGTIYERDHYKELLPDVRTTQVLFVRVVLALIGHQGPYNDHTQSPSVEKPLSEPSGV